MFRTDRKVSTEPDETYKGNLLNFDDLYKWVQDKCIPLVREITFENAEELTEEGLPFLILFHHPTDTESVKKYKEIVSRELESEKRKKPILIFNLSVKCFSIIVCYLLIYESDLTLSVISIYYLHNSVTITDESVKVTQ